MDTRLDKSTDLTLRVVAVATGLLAAAMFVFILRVTWVQTLDDAFIWFRYAENLSAGYGPTFNLTGPRAEGYTGFLWLWVMAVPHWLGIDPVSFSKVVGSAFGVATLLLTYRFAGQLADFSCRGIRWFAGAAAVFNLACSHAIGVHSTSGMETSIYTFCLLLFFYLCMRFGEGSHQKLVIWLPVVALLVGLGRPEGNLATGLGLSAILFRSSSDVRKKLLSTSLWLLLIPGAAYFLWRLWYYGVLLPLPFYVSLIGPEGSGLRALSSFAGQIGLPAGILLLVGLFRCTGRIPGSVAAGAALVVLFLFPSHRMGSYSRYFFPVLPLICAVSGCGCAVLLQLLKTRIETASRRRSAVIAGSLALVALIAVGHYSELSPQGLQATRDWFGYLGRMHKSRHIALGKTLAEIGEGLGRRPVLAISDAGAVPYYSKWHVIDTRGLNNAHIARSGGHDPEYVLSQSPDLVVIVSRRVNPVVPIVPWQDDLYQACLSAGLQVIRSYGNLPYVQVVMGKAESEIARRLRQ